MNSVSEIITNSLTDGRVLSVLFSSVTPLSIANSVANKKTTHRRNTNSLTDGYARANFFFPAGTLSMD